MTNIIGAHELRDTTKAIDWEGLVSVIAFKNSPDRADGMLVLIVSTQIME
jgi:hypothetical protein